MKTVKTCNMINYSKQMIIANEYLNKVHCSQPLAEQTCFARIIKWDLQFDLPVIFSIKINTEFREYVFEEMLTTYNISLFFSKCLRTRGWVLHTAFKIITFKFNQHVLNLLIANVSIIFSFVLNLVQSNGSVHVYKIGARNYTSTGHRVCAGLEIKI